MHPAAKGLSLTGLTLLAFAPAAYAEDDTHADAVTLDDVVVVAEREPGNFAIDRDEIELTQASDLSDLLSNQSGAAVGGGSPVAQKVYVRGFEDTLLNVTVDGAQQTAELYHHQTRVQVEPEFVKSIELDAGAGAATSGSGVLTGAMRVVTRNAFDLLEPDRDVGALLKGGAGFNGGNHYKGVLAAYGRLSDDIGLLATFVKHDGDDYADGRGDDVSPTAFDHERAQARLTGLFGDHTVDLSFERLVDSGTYYERPHMRNFTGRFVLSDHTLRRTTATYNHRFDPSSEAVDAVATAYRNVSEYANHRNTTGMLYGRGEQTSHGMDVRNTMHWESIDLTYGTDYRRDRLHARQQATPPPFWGDTAQSVTVLGAYGQATWRPSETWTFSTGVRWDDYRHRVDAGLGAGNTNSQARFSPNASIEWQPLQGLRVRAAYSEAFRGVTVREAFFSALYTHHGDLEGEDADNIELGVAWERDDWFARATAYRQHIGNYINALYTWDAGTEWGRWANMGRARVKGYEAEAGRRWEHLELAMGVWNADNSFNGRTLTDADLGLGTSIGRTWTARADWRTDDARSRYGLRLRHVEAEANDISPTAPDKPAYTTVDLLANWRLMAGGNLSFGLALNNAFDRYYFDHGTYSYHPSGRYVGFPASGRELVASVSYRF